MQKQMAKALCNFDQTQKIISDIYDNNHIFGFGASEEITAMIAEKGGSATYGEIIPKSVQVLLDELNMTEHDTFYDLGCGVGKLCMQVALVTPANSIGVELSPKRFNDAKKAQQILLETHSIKVNDRLHFFEQSILDTEIKPNPIVYLGSTCYPDQLMAAIVEKLKKVPGTKRVFSTKTMPGLTATKTYTLPMTWAEKTDVFYYVF